MFTPVKITPLPRRGSPLTLIPRRILVAAAVMALLATLAAHAGSETQGAPLPDPIQTQQASVLAQPLEGNDQGNDFPSSISRSRGLPQYLPAHPGTPAWHASPALERGSPGGQATWARGRGDPSRQEVEALATPMPVPPTPTPIPPTPTPASSPTPLALQVAGQGVPLSDLEGQMWEAINGERAHVRLPPLAIDGRLVGLARERSNDMMSRAYFSHTTPEENTIFDFLDARGIYSPYAGENLARSNGEVNQVVPLAVSGFMNSPPHRKNVLNSHYTHLGIGEAISPEGIRYFTLVFIGVDP